ncbi:MAG: sporulation initiation factor Spo0A C-terminal domain-containing protein [Christensenellaceae bacterium]|jgi:two-component system response regulator (stage 0 sporulation protein A)|nr:sporulation initiation factor Spo0A C-terminal domain-containing protein [Christensenellaceae bacterium]
MGNYQILILGSPGLLERFHKAGNKLEIIKTLTIEEAERHVVRCVPSAIITELIIPTAERYEFISSLNALPEKPLQVVVGSLADDNYYERAKRMGAKFSYREPFEADMIFDDIQNALMDLELTETIDVKNTSERALDERLAHILISAGIPPHIRGYQFLREAVKLSTRSPSMINNITKRLYPAVALKFNTTPSKVERAIRHAIEVAWERGKIENINALYGIKIFAKGEKPTNGELIALVSDKLIIECV